MSPVDPSQTTRIWRTDLDAWDPARFLDVLSPDERRQRLRLRSEIDRQRAIVARGLLRELLGGALELAAAEVPLGVGEWGKPRLVGLADPADRHPVAFSQSRSGPMALFACSEGRRIGVDVERIRPLRDRTALAEAILAPRELAIARSDAGRDLDLVVLRTWTLKEAFLKAVGTGLACPPHLVELTAASLRGHRPPRLRAVDDDPDVARRWLMHSFAPDDGTVAALVIERPDDDHGRRTCPQRAPSVAGVGRAGLLSAGTRDGAAPGLVDISRGALSRPGLRSEEVPAGRSVAAVSARPREHHRSSCGHDTGRSTVEPTVASFADTATESRGIAIFAIDAELAVGAGRRDAP